MGHVGLDHGGGRRGVAFIAVEKRVPVPLLDLALLRN
jgi:hypothetical protein